VRVTMSTNAPRVSAGISHVRLPRVSSDGTVIALWWVGV
jgi:hypothetical protein